MTEARYPIYVISKGRSDVCLTARFLDREGVPFSLVVEPQEADAYADRFGRERLLVLPFFNLGLGSIPARNFVWEHAKESGAARHWILDDNIRGVYRRWKARKIPCDAAPAFRASEDFVDRYENVAIAGLNYFMFSANRTKQPPFCLNVHVYSCLLIRNDLPQRWRGRYNEDTDLCLQVLSAGLCTVLFNAFLVWKQPTMTTKGGNSAELYKGDGRLKMARSLERAWPHVVETKRRFNRPQHVVRDSWRRFDTPLIRRSDVDWAALERAGADEFGMALKQVGETKSETLRALVAERVQSDAARGMMAGGEPCRTSSTKSSGPSRASTSEKPTSSSAGTRRRPRARSPGSPRTR